jgi:hypothetical protein
MYFMANNIIFLNKNKKKINNEKNSILIYDKNFDNIFFKKCDMIESLSKDVLQKLSKENVNIINFSRRKFLTIFKRNAHHMIKKILSSKKINAIERKLLFQKINIQNEKKKREKIVNRIALLVKVNIFHQMKKDKILYEKKIKKIKRKNLKFVKKIKSNEM